MKSNVTKTQIVIYYKTEEFFELLFGVIYNDLKII